MISVIMIDEVLNEERWNLLSSILDSSSIEYELRKEQNAVVVHGDNDAVRKAKSVLEDRGFAVM